MESTCRRFSSDGTSAVETDVVAKADYQYMASVRKGDRVGENIDVLS